MEGNTKLISARPEASTNQPGISWDLATSPFSRASSSRRCVGSSVFWLSSSPSAIGAPLQHVRGEALHALQPDGALIAPSAMVRMNRPTMMLDGMAMKKIWAWGISRESTPRAR